MRLTAVKLDGGKLIGYQSTRVRWRDALGMWRDLRRRGYYTRFEV